MHHDMKRFVREILKSPRRRAIPIMTSPGIDLIGAKPVEVFRDGDHFVAAKQPSRFNRTVMEFILGR